MDCFLALRKSFRLPLDFYSSLNFSYFFRVFDYYYSSYVLMFIFYYNFYDPTRFFSRFKISRAFFWTKALLPFRFKDKDFRNLSFTSASFLF